MNAATKLLLEISKEIRLPLDIITERLAFVGQSGSGKTYAAMRLAELMLGAGAQIVALDPMGVWWGLLSTADGKASGFPVYVFGGSHGHISVTPEAGALVAEVIVEKQISAVIDISLWTRGEQVQFALAFSERFFRLQTQTKRPVHLFLEEAQTFMPQNLPAEGRGGDPKKNPAVMLNRMELIARQGRSQGIGCSMITQAPQSVAKSCLNQAGTLFAMRTIGKHERKAVGDWMADKATDDSQLKLDQLLPKLNTGEAWVASPNLLNVYQLTRISQKTTFDSSATPKFGAKVSEPKVLAAVDVDHLRTAMAATIEAATADDPKALRKRIAELERQLKAKPAAAPAPKVETKVIEKPVLKDGQLQRAEAIAEKLSQLQVAIGAELAPLLEALRAVKAPAPVVAPRPALRSVPPPRARPATPAAERDAELGAGERAVLTAAAQHGDQGVDREQLTVLTGYKRSTRNTYIQRLTAAGYVEQRGEIILATDEGLGALGPNFEPLPTGDELLRHWLGRLPEGERVILEALVAAYPGDVERESLSETTGYKRSTRNTYLQRLGARKLIETSGETVRASAELFLGAA